jgi:hypothetical protein
MTLTYRAADKVIEQYHRSDAPIKYLRGPRASTKTVAAIMEMWSRSCRIKPGKDKVRRSRWLLSRKTYPSINRTILNSVVDWLGPYGELRMSTPPVINFKLPLKDGTMVESEWLFMAVPDENSFQDFRSLELTGAFTNECIEHPFGLITALAGCFNRYPSLNSFAPEDLVGPDGEPVPPYQSVHLLDTNPGPDDDAWRTGFEDAPPRGALMLVQPGAFMELDEAEFRVWQQRVPGADYIKKFNHYYVPNPAATYARFVNGGYKYWADMIETATSRAEVQKLVCNQWATTATGKACFPAYDDNKHWGKQEQDPIHYLPLHIGLDHSGLHPAAVIGQVVGGQLRLLDEVIFEDDKAGMTFTEFVQSELGPLLASRYAGMEAQIHLDPAIMRSQIDGRTVFNVLVEAGLTGRPAATNDPKMRRDAVTRWLMRPGALVISPRLPRLRAALRGGYQFKTNSQGVPTTEVVKNKHSHPAEGLQYLCVGIMAGTSSGSTLGKSERTGALMAR